MLLLGASLTVLLHSGPTLRAQRSGRGNMAAAWRNRAMSKHSPPGHNLSLYITAERSEFVMPGVGEPNAQFLRFCTGLKQVKPGSWPDWAICQNSSSGHSGRFARNWPSFDRAPGAELLDDPDLAKSVQAASRKSFEGYKWLWRAGKQ